MAEVQTRTAWVIYCPKCGYEGPIQTRRADAEQLALAHEAITHQPSEPSPCKCGGGGPATVHHDPRGCYDMGHEPSEPEPGSSLQG